MQQDNSVDILEKKSLKDLKFIAKMMGHEFEPKVKKEELISLISGVENKEQVYEQPTLQPTLQPALQPTLNDKPRRGRPRKSPLPIDTMEPAITQEKSLPELVKKSLDTIDNIDETNIIDNNTEKEDTRIEANNINNLIEDINVNEEKDVKKDKDVIEDVIEDVVEDKDERSADSFEAKRRRGRPRKEYNVSSSDVEIPKNNKFNSEINNSTLDIEPEIESKDQIIEDINDDTIQSMQDGGIRQIKENELDEMFEEGILELLPEGYGFLRLDNYYVGAKDVYVAHSIIKKFRLRTGDLIRGKVKNVITGKSFRPLYHVSEINGYPTHEMIYRRQFETLTPIYPDKKINLEIGTKELATRVIDLVAPIGNGQRGLIVSPPKAGKTILLKRIANSISINHPDSKLIILLIDERPEEVTDMQRSTKGEVVFSTFDEVPEHHVKIAEMVLERAMRLVEMNQDVVVLLDSITRLARAYNLTIPATGRTLSGGIDPGALHRPKKFFGAARNIENGGSLTIIATALVDTGSRMDDVIYEEFKGTGNMELHLDRKLSEKRIFPAIDINKSGTRKEELLLSEMELEVIWQLRKTMTNFGTAETTEFLTSKLERAKTNADFVKMVYAKGIEIAKNNDMY